jgi:hypothetical protein
MESNTCLYYIYYIYRWMLTTYWHEHMTWFVQIWENDGYGTNRKIKRLLYLSRVIVIYVYVHRDNHTHKNLDNTFIYAYIIPIHVLMSMQPKRIALWLISISNQTISKSNSCWADKGHCLLFIKILKTRFTDLHARTALGLQLVPSIIENTAP